MPIFSRGYTKWDGELRGRAFRWLTIARWGIHLTGKSKWLKRIVLTAWLPLLYYILAFFVAGQLTEVSTIQAAEEMWQFGAMRAMFGSRLAEEFIADPAAFRPMIWAGTFHMFLHWSLLFWVMLVVAIVGPKLVSEDMQSRSLSLYFSKPLTRIDYIVGKLAVVGWWVGIVTLIPGLVLYLLSIAFSPGVETIFQTWTVLPSLFAYSLLVMVGMGSAMLALSSLTSNTRFLGFLWVGFWVMSMMASKVLSRTLFPRPRRAPPVEDDWSSMLSFAHNFDAVGFRLFDVKEQVAPATEISARAERYLRVFSYGHEWWWSLVLILVVSAVSLAVIWRQIGRPGEAGSK